MMYSPVPEEGGGEASEIFYPVSRAMNECSPEVLHATARLEEEWLSSAQQPQQRVAAWRRQSDHKQCENTDSCHMVVM